MLKKKMLFSALLLGMITMGFTSEVFAAEGDLGTIEGKNGQTTATVDARGNLGDIDPTDPVTPLPEGDDRWIKVTLPTAVVFGSDSEDNTKITTVSNYEIKNESGRPVKVDVTKYEITGGEGATALSELNLERSKGYTYDATSKSIKESETSTVKLTKEKGVGNDKINTEFVRLANNEGKIGELTSAQSKASFKFTGTVSVDDLKANSNNYVESSLTFKFTALRLDGTKASGEN